MRLLGFALLLSCLAPAQTFIVDAGNGPGTNFTSISAAVAAVPDGATLLVRPGSYATFTIDAKGLTLIGGAGVNLSGHAFLQNSQAGQTIALHGFGLQLNYVFPTIHVGDCRGAVLLDDLRITGSAQDSPVSLRITNSDQVMVQDCTLWSVWVGGSSVVFNNCAMDGRFASCGLGTCSGSEPALEVASGDVTLLGCTLQGGHGLGYGFYQNWRPNQPALVCAGHARVLAPCTLQAGTGLSMPAVPSITGTGTVDIDPAAQLVPAPAGSLSANYAPMPTALASSAAVGTSMVASAGAPVTSVAILVVGFRGLPITVPGIGHAFWINPAVYQFAAIGTAPLQSTFSVPAQPALVGVILAWQTVAALPGGLQASNPSWSLIR